ncbi:hypothetical protein [Hoeflea sp. BAL378]|uniref:hypothetical protein n=1 Tax=Hoeflea sp. BAL378 TaxID=1547437 RepID=UPI0012699252|nr:hypothetical protein [Hoeflea sp. BAL378]
MTKSLRFVDIPPEEFPLRDEQYKRLKADIYSAACGFSDLRTDDAHSVARELTTTQYHLDRAWALIVGIEDAERRREWDEAT